MVLLHYSPTLKKRCGIAEFAKGLNQHLGFEISDSLIVAADSILLEHEYAYDKECWESIEMIRPPNVYIYMHSASIAPINNLAHTRINTYCKGVFVATEAMKNLLANVIKIPIHVIEHYSEPMIDQQKTSSEGITIGMHGFAIPRTCISRAIAELNHNKNAKLFIMCTLNEATAQHMFISKTYLDRCRSICARENLLDRIEFDFNYYESKSDISKKLAEKCDMILILQDHGGDTLNASGTARVALSSGRPVVVPNYSQFDGLPDGVVYRIKDNCRESVRDMLKDPQKVIDAVDISAVKEYINKTSPERTATKIKSIMGI